MKNFGMVWPTDNFIKDLTTEEKMYIDIRREACGMYPDIIDILYWLCRESEAKNILEIGTGHSLIPLLLACIRNGGKLFSTDISSTICPDSIISQFNIQQYSNSNIWSYKFGIDSVELAKRWSGEMIDFIYLDSSHTYEQTVREINEWLPNLKVGGWFVFHDVVSCANGVLRPITEFLLGHSSDFEFHHYPICHGFGILIKKK